MDDKSIRAGVEGCWAMAEVLAGAKVAKVGKEEQLPKEVTAKGVEGIKVKPDIRDPLLESYVQCWKKWFPNTPIGPEVVAFTLTAAVLKGWKDLIGEMREMGREQREGQKTAALQ